MCAGSLITPGCAGGARLERYFGGGEVGGSGLAENWKGVSGLPGKPVWKMWD